MASSVWDTKQEGAQNVNRCSRDKQVGAQAALRGGNSDSTCHPHSRTFRYGTCPGVSGNGTVGQPSFYNRSGAK